MSRIYLFFEDTVKPGMPEIPERLARLTGNRPPGGAGPILRLQPCAFPGGGVFGSGFGGIFYEAGRQAGIARGLGESVPRKNLAVCAISRRRSGGGSGTERAADSPSTAVRVGAQEGPGETNLEKWLAYEARLKAAGPERVGFLTRGAYRVAVCAEETDAIYDGDTGEKL